MRDRMRCGIMAVLIMTPLAARGQATSPDQVVPVVVPGTVLSASLATFAYDPTSDSMFLTAFGNPAMLKVTDVGGTQIFTPLVFETTLQLYYRDGNPDRGVTTPTQGGMLLNPKPVGTNAAYSFALIADAGNTRFPASSIVDPAATKKFYAYNLQPAAFPGDGTDVFTTRVTLADLQAIAEKTTNSTSLARQFAWSGDGQSIYFVDSSPGYDGVWKLGAVSGAPQRILDANLENTEPGVVSSGGVDRIYFSGITGDTGVGNAGGIDFITHDGTTTSGPQVAVSVAKLLDFFEVGAAMSSQRIGSVAFHGDDMYFSLFNSNSATDPLSRYQGLYRMDAEGRLSKVANRTERAAAFSGSVNQVFDRLQPREITSTASAEPFAVTQILYRESGANTVAGAIAFKPGDFDRDNTVTAADVDLFRQQVTSRGVVNADVANLKFDMNGNDVIDWKDVQILEQFLDYVPDPTLVGRVIPELTIKADTNLDGLVDFADFRILRDNYAPGVTGRSFVLGDSSGDDRVDFVDLQPWVNSAGYRSAVIGEGVPETPFDQAEWNAFLARLTPPDVVLDVTSGTNTQFEQGYRSIVIAASVTKTGGGAVVFDGANSYAGTTVVAEGTLIVDPQGTFGTSPLIDVRAGATLDASGLAGGLAVAAGQTLAGGGVIMGSVVFGRNSTLSPGLASEAISGPRSLGGLSSGGQVAVVPEPAFAPLLAVIAASAACRLFRRRQEVPGVVVAAHHAVARGERLLREEP
jgi:autotransporter-associated beta strand protein